MNNIKIEKRNKSKNKDWKSFFDLKIFRYAFIKQAKSMSTYIYLAMTIIICTLILWYLSSTFEKIDKTDEMALSKHELTVFTYNVFVILLYTIMFTLFIAFKSLQIFRDEMEDGSLLILSSMPYSRLRLIVQKWLSLQIICLVFSGLVIYTTPVIFMLFSGFTDASKDVYEILYKDSIVAISASLVYQILLSSFMILISLFIGKTGIISCATLLAVLSVIGTVLPGILVKKTAENLLIDNQAFQFAKLSNEIGLNKYLKNPDLKSVWELADRSNLNEKKIEFVGNNKDEIISDFQNLAISKDLSKAKDLFDKLNNKMKYENKTFKLLPVKLKMNSESNVEIDENDDSYNLIKSFDESNQRSEKEKKIIQLSKAIIDYQKKQSDWNKEIQPLEGIIQNKMLLILVAYNYFKADLDNQIDLTFLVNPLPNDKEFYVIEDPELRYGSFLINSIFKRISINKKSTAPDEILKIHEKSRSIKKINSYINIMTHMQTLWIRNYQYTQFNVDSEWEVKEMEIVANNHSKQILKYLELKPKSVKMLIRPIWLYITYISISIVISFATVWIINKKDFT